MYESTGIKQIEECLAKAGRLGSVKLAGTPLEEFHSDPP